MKRTLALLVSVAGIFGGDALAAPPAPAKPGPAHRAPAAKPKRPAPKPVAKKPAPSPPGQVDEAARARVAGGPTREDTEKGAESPELRALRALELELFQAPAAPRVGVANPEDGFPVAIDPDKPVVHATGLARRSEPRPDEAIDLAARPDLAWLRTLRLPDITVRWDARLVRYLQHFKDDPRGRALLAVAWRRSGRYEALIKATLRQEKVPAALLWLAMTESSFEPTARSPVGAAGLWQFMPHGARLYGLRVERLVDERLDPVKSTVAAAKFLSDLERRFGSWELALAAYNMGYGGLLTAIRKYNTNDYWELSKFEAGLPWETTLYVPKILAFAIAAENPEVFGLSSLPREPAVAFDAVDVPAGVTVAAIARASGADERIVTTMNPQLRAGRVPQGPTMPATMPVRVPEGTGSRTLAGIRDAARADPPVGTHTTRFGETLDSIASLYGTTRSRLADLNAMTIVDVPRAGEPLLVPAGLTPKARPVERPVVVVPASPSSLPGRRRVFYRVITGDTLREVAHAFGVSQEELRNWNALDPGARLQDGMTLQVFVDPGKDLSGTLSLAEGDAEVLVVGTDTFFEHFEAQKGRRRTTHVIGPTDTWASISKQYGISIGMLERINRRARTAPLVAGETLVVYTGRPVAPGIVPDRDDDAVAGKPADDTPSAPSGAAPPAPPPSASAPPAAPPPSASP